MSLHQIRRYHKHTLDGFLDGSGRRRKAVTLTPTLHYFSMEAFNIPPAGGGELKLLDIVALHSKVRAAVVTAVCDSPEDTSGPSLKCLALLPANSAPGLPFNFLQGAQTCAGGPVQFFF